MLPRSSGILLHISSLPSAFGIGDLGPEAYRFVDFLAEAGQTFWQILPLNPPGVGNSPYVSSSAMAGAELLVSPEKLAEEGLLSPQDWQNLPAFPQDRVDYPTVRAFKGLLLRKAFEKFKASGRFQAEFEIFCSRQAHWLDDYALFMAIKEAHRGAPWNEWEPELALRYPEALETVSRKLAEDTLFHKFSQFIFDQQWEALRRYAAEKGIRIIGDIPIYVAYDSADVWAHPEFFQLDEKGLPTVVAGVPPDYFSPTGQLWGNPIYRWEVLAERGYDWWIKRFQRILEYVDVVRVDHFRGFEAYWEVPAGEETAIKGRWVKGPGAELFNALKSALGEVPIIAEDLGFITPEVEALREQFGFPGMKVLQFAFGSGPDNSHLPHNYPRNCVVYTGTHDNDTAVGWFNSASEGVREHFCKYTGTDGHEVNWVMARLAMASVADLAIIPLQDILGLGSEARMNYPGRPDGNWQWRFLPGSLTPEMKSRLAELTGLYGRWRKG
jgi:4-alpha-glucanotransferase